MMESESSLDDSDVDKTFNVEAEYHPLKRGKRQLSSSEEEAVAEFKNLPKRGKEPSPGQW